MRNFAHRFHFHTFPASPATTAFPGISQHFNSGGGGDWWGNVGTRIIREVCAIPFAFLNLFGKTFAIYFLVLLRHLWGMGGREGDFRDEPSAQHP